LIAGEFQSLKEWIVGKFQSLRRSELVVKPYHQISELMVKSLTLRSKLVDDIYFYLEKKHLHKVYASTHERKH